MTYCLVINNDTYYSVSSSMNFRSICLLSILTFTNGSTVTGSTSGATATITAYDSVNTPAVVSVNSISGVFLRGETLTSGAVNYPISSTNAFDAV